MSPENAHTTARAEEERRTQKPDEFLVAWVHGTASYDLFTKYHANYWSSPHKRNTGEFEVAVFLPVRAHAFGPLRLRFIHSRWACLLMWQG